MGSLISVIINTCDAKDYMKNCIENVVNQTYKNIEILVIDNCVNDKISKICSKYNDKRIKIIKESNNDHLKILQSCINNSKGDYLYFVDARDFLDDDVIEKLYNICLDYNVDVSLSDTANIYNYNYLNTSLKENIDIITGYQMINKEVMKNKKIDLFNKLINKKVLETSLENEKIDKIFLKIERIAFCNQKKYFYCRDGIAI
ncbi:MAG: glycosyltransferase family 2 protein [Clostridia bacterium]|nr:glycosyltransferase family 2 protein [Clostridia bacterium]